jgi:hypothetical protein
VEVSAHLMRVLVGVYHDLPVVLGSSGIALALIWFFDKMQPRRRRPR